jgi:hypothetical protein
MSDVVAVEMDSRTLSRQVDGCVRDLDRLEREMAEVEERGEEIPEDMVALLEAERAHVAELREKLAELALIEKLGKKLRRRRKDRSVAAVPVGDAVLVPSDARSVSRSGKRG